MTHIITISRQFGSGGRTIGKEVAKELGIPCYDSELIEKVAEDSGFAHEYIREHGEYAAQTSWIARTLNAGAGLRESNQDVIWVAQRKAVVEVSKKGPCVIVGRCADYILRGKADLLTVFIHASMKKREERIVRVYGESDEMPEKRLRDKDKRRAAYYKFYTDIEWGLAKNYDVCLDSGKLGLDTCVDVIKQLYLKKSEQTEK